MNALSFLITAEVIAIGILIYSGAGIRIILYIQGVCLVLFAVWLFSCWDLRSLPEFGVESDGHASCRLYIVLLIIFWTIGSMIAAAISFRISQRRSK